MLFNRHGIFTGSLRVISSPPAVFWLALLLQLVNLTHVCTGLLDFIGFFLLPPLNTQRVLAFSDGWWTLIDLWMQYLQTVPVFKETSETVETELCDCLFSAEGETSKREQMN